jgi:LuxR family transcriptional regulator, maltose regulon positive regulatory protein
MLHPPVARKEWVERPKLLQFLVDGEVKLTLVAAPPGFGKTTLIAQWRSNDHRPFAWVSLENADNDPVRLWRHVVSSLDVACPGFDGDKVLAMLRGQDPDLAGAVLPVLVNEMAVLPEQVVLVFDDYHLLKAAPCHEQVALLLGHLPPRVRCVIATRADPPLPLARMRALGEMAEIRAGDLRFDRQEAAELIHAVASVELSERDVDRLVMVTEGWAAGLYLAALSMRRHPSPNVLARQFSGTNRFIADYLVEDVLNQQPSSIREFLMRTSILSRFCAPLCDAVTGSTDAAAIIEALERENLFVVPFGERRRWFRYHHLFGQVLRGQLARIEPDLVPSLHARASAWYRAHGSTDEAIQHALAASDIEGASELIARHFRAYNASGRDATVRFWLREIGDDRIASSPLAAHCAVWTAAGTGDQQVIRRWLPTIEAAGDAGPLPDGMRSFASSAALVRLLCGFDGIGPMREAGERAVALETDPGSRWYSAAHSGLSIALYWTGDFDAASIHAREGRLNPETGVPFRLLASTVMTWLATEAGQFARAAEAAREAWELGTSPSLGLDGTARSSYAYLAAGVLDAGQGQLDEARTKLEQAIEMRWKRLGICPWPTLEGLLRLAPVVAGLGDRPQAIALLGEARQLLDSRPDGAEAQLARLERLERRLAATPQSTASGEQLTGREQDVLRMLQSALSLRDIGRELYLSLNTIKTHTRALYRKLDVSGRQEAVTRGRELGLI